MDQISWKWSRGPELEFFDFSSRYALLCIYDTSSGSSSLASRLEIQDDFTFWRSNLFTSNKFYSKEGNDDGVFRASFKAGSEGRSSVTLAARGLKTRLPMTFSGTEMFDQENGVTVQLFKHAYEACWTSTFPTADRNSPSLFKASLP